MEKTTQSNTSVWIIGGGKMGEAFLGGAFRYFSEIGREKDLLVIEPVDTIRDQLSCKYPVLTFPSVGNVLQAGLFPEVIFFAVKPDRFPELSEELLSLSSASSSALAISVMAGVTLSQLERSLPDLRWVRTMSNLALTTGEGMTVIAPGSLATISDERLVLELFSRMGKAICLPERDFDIATAIAGSGPGFMALVGDALVDSGVLHGLKKETASLLVAQMFVGTGTLLLSGSFPAELKGQVSSPGGTTIEGLASLESRAVRGAFIEAVSAAVKKSRLLGEGGAARRH
ncbi:MAG: pyrroline-5-carboxylate reductase [Leptospirillum sp.]